MALEQDINSIAVSITTIAKMLGMLIDQKQEKQSEPTVSIVEPVAKPKKLASRPVFTEPEVPTKQYTTADLKALAQKIANGLKPDDIKTFTDFVVTQVCKPFNAVKLSDIPQTNINEAAAKMAAYAKNGGIDVE